MNIKRYLKFHHLEKNALNSIAPHGLFVPKKILQNHGLTMGFRTSTLEFRVGKKPLFHSEVLLNNASSKWWACHPTKEDQMNSIYSYFFHHFLNPCGFFPQQTIKSRIVPPKKQISGTVQGEYPWCGWVILLPTKNPHILVALHRITNSQHAVLETSFQWVRFCAWRRSREIPSSHLQKKTETEFEVCEQHRGALNTKHISLHKLFVFCFKCHCHLSC